MPGPWQNRATLWWTLRSDKAAPQWRAILRGYTRVRKLSSHEKALLPAFVIIREFELRGFHLMIRKHIGDAWLGARAAGRGGVIQGIDKDLTLDATGQSNGLTTDR